MYDFKDIQSGNFSGIIDELTFSSNPLHTLSKLIAPNIGASEKWYSTDIMK